MDDQVDGQEATNLRGNITSLNHAQNQRVPHIAHPAREIPQRHQKYKYKAPRSFRTLPWSQRLFPGRSIFCRCSSSDRVLPIVAECTHIPQFPPICFAPGRSEGNPGPPRRIPRPTRRRGDGRRESQDAWLIRALVPSNFTPRRHRESTSFVLVPDALIDRFSKVRPRSTEDVVKVVDVARQYRIPVVPYSGATSLEGHFSGVRPSSVLSHFILLPNTSLRCSTRQEASAWTCRAWIRLYRSMVLPRHGSLVSPSNFVRSRRLGFDVPGWG